MQRCHRLTTAFIMIGLITAGANVQGEDPFPTTAPGDVGMSAEALGLLSDRVQDLVAKETIVGGELHIIKDRKTVLRRAYGWADREEKRAMETDTVFCVRSMTKPLLGAAIQMLLDANRLALTQKVAEVLPEFDVPGLREITIEQLLTHTSGLPMTAIQRPLSDYASLREIAADAAKAGIDFKPGTSFQYSDAGSDTLGAVLATVTRQSAEDFIRDRILKPVGMDRTIALLHNDARRAQIPSAYSGGTGDWRRHWSSDDSPLFPIFLTSQSLYTTTTDYARFITLWMDRGTIRERQLLSGDAVRRALTPISRIRGYPTGFDNLRLSYGQQWMVYHHKDSPHPVVFGHNGSDGTHAWAWPEQDLIVLFFTQSRGTDAGVDLESAIQRLLIEADVKAYRQDMAEAASIEQSYEPYCGLYWDEDVEDAYYAFSIEKNNLIMERPGRMRAIASPTKEQGRFTVGRSLKIKFEAGDRSPAMLMTTRSRTERQVRHKLQAGLPSIEKVISQVSSAHGISASKDAGIIKRSGTIKMGPLGIRGEIRQWFDARNSRTAIKIGPQSMVVIQNGDEVAATGLSGSVERLEGVARHQEAVGHPAIEYGGWRRGYTQLEVLKRLKNNRTLLVRAKAADLPEATLLVDTETWLVTGANRIQFIPGVGYVGLETQYKDFRKVGGTTLPFQIESRHAYAMIGKVIVSFDESESGITDDDLFDLPQE